MFSEYSQADGFIVGDVLETIKQKSETYSYETLKGLNALKELGKCLSIKRVKSLRGTFQQAKLAGLCLSSGWAKKHLSTESENTFIPELMRLVISMSTSDFTQIRLSDKLPEEAIEICLIRGFESGIRLGQLAAQQLNGRSMSTENLALFLDDFHQQERSKILTAPVLGRANRIQKQTRQFGHGRVD